MIPITEGDRITWTEPHGETRAGVVEAIAADDGMLLVRADDGLRGMVDPDAARVTGETTAVVVAG